MPLLPPDRYATRMNERPEVARRAAQAYRTLAELAETVDDEWVYVNDLAEAYLPAIESLENGDAPSPSAAIAVDEAIAEIALITDPHKAIDWLSTFPHVVALALGGDVDDLGGRGGADDNRGHHSGDDLGGDSPFRVLLGGRK